MKRGTILRVAFIVYIVAMIGMFIGVDQYVKAKDQRLRTEIHEKIDEIFAGRKQYVDISYSGYKVGYERVSIPEKPKPLGHHDEEINKFYEEMNRKSMDAWTENYGNLTRLYRTHYKRSDWASPSDYKDGWNLVILEHDYEGVYETWIFPYAVGYIKQENSWFYDFAPSVPSAVNEAFDFYTKNEKSVYYGSFEKGCVERVWTEIFDAGNKYYYMAKDERPRFNRSGSPLFEQKPTNNQYFPYQNGYMYNGYYKVFVAATQPQTYSIKKREWNPDEIDKKDLWLYWSIGLTTLLLIVVIPLAVIQRKHNKEKDESLYDKLKRLCNPANFITTGNYDKEKVDKANEIYKRLQEISPNDKEVLNEIQLQAIYDLGINLINQDKLDELKEKVNPKKFLNPYNAEKVASANELYAILTKENLTYEELVEVEERSKSL